MVQQYRSHRSIGHSGSSSDALNGGSRIKRSFRPSRGCSKTLVHSNFSQKVFSCTEPTGREISG
jgi:hypothetical protein